VAFTSLSFEKHSLGFRVDGTFFGSASDTVVWIDISIEHLPNVTPHVTINTRDKELSP